MKNDITRRDFIKMTGTAALAVTCSGLLAGCGGDSKTVTSEYKFIPEIELTFSNSWSIEWSRSYQDAFSATANGQKMYIQNGSKFVSYTLINQTQTHKPEFKTTKNEAAASFKDGGTVELTVKFNNKEETFVLTKNGANYSAVLKGGSTNEADFGNLKVKVKGASYSVSESTT